MTTRAIVVRALIVVAAVLVIVLVFAERVRRDRLGDLRRYPGAAVVGSTSYIGEAFGLPRASWEQIELRTTAPYEQVRDFYAKAALRGLTSTFESELPKSDGRVYTRFLADAARRIFYVVTVEERLRSRDVGVLLRRGTAR